jgi:hypothetical protein
MVTKDLLPTPLPTIYQAGAAFLTLTSSTLVNRSDEMGKSRRHRSGKIGRKDRQRSIKEAKKACKTSTQVIPDMSQTYL